MMTVEIIHHKWDTDEITESLREWYFEHQIGMEKLTINGKAIRG
jgi:hypothetical protein